MGTPRTRANRDHMPRRRQTKTGVLDLPNIPLIMLEPLTYTPCTSSGMNIYARVKRPVKFLNSIRKWVITNAKRFGFACFVPNLEPSPKGEMVKLQG